jgi:DNA-directed RNA polymerase specialized sigma24 family protein
MAQPWAKSKLTAQQWDEIMRRYAEGETSAQLAAEFGVSASVIKGRVSRR